MFMCRSLETRLSSKDRSEHVERRKAQIALERKKLLLEKDKEAASSKMRAKKVDVVQWFQGLVLQGSRKIEAQQNLDASTPLRAQLDTDLALCQRKMAALERQLSATGAAAREVQDLGDEAEYLMAEVEFRTLEADKAAKAVTDADLAAQQVQLTLASLPDLEVRRLVLSCYDDGVEYRMDIHRSRHQLHESEVALLQATRALEEARVQSQALREAHDSEKTGIQLLYEEKLAFFLEQLHLHQPLALSLPPASSPAVSPSMRALQHTATRAPSGASTPRPCSPMAHPSDAAIAAKEPYISTNEPYTSTKEPDIPAKAPYNAYNDDTLPHDHGGVRMRVGAAIDHGAYGSPEVARAQSARKAPMSPLATSASAETAAGRSWGGGGEGTINHTRKPLTTGNF